MAKPRKDRLLASARGQLRRTSGVKLTAEVLKWMGFAHRDAAGPSTGVRAEFSQRPEVGRVRCSEKDTR